jgi:RNA recognition motif-containing protein
MAGSSLFVGNLPYSTSEQDLRELMGRSGARVAEVRLVTDLDTGRSRGYAFVEMGTAEEARKAIAELNGFNLDGRSIVVNEARTGGEATRGGPGSIRRK